MLSARYLVLHTRYLVTYFGPGPLAYSRSYERFMRFCTLLLFYRKPCSTAYLSQRQVFILPQVREFITYPTVLPTNTLCLVFYLLFPQNYGTSWTEAEGAAKERQQQFAPSPFISICPQTGPTLKLPP